MSDKRYLKLEGKKAGPFSLRQIMRMTELGEADYTTEFWARSTKSWQPLSKMLWDFEPCRVDEMKEAGITKVEVLGTGTGQDCPACLELQGRVFHIDDKPELPPPNCTCLPWCRSMFVAAG